mgnify:CR=1 FL=1
MPELPDVETRRRYIDATALHQKIKSAVVNAPRMLKGISAKDLISALKSHAFSETGRHGKFLFVRFDDKAWLVLHFGMSGTLAYTKDESAVPEGARLRIDFANGYHLAGIWQRRLGRIGLTVDPATFVKQEGLGPDAMTPGIDLSTFKRMLGGRRGSVKPALMDQKFIAGIGNIYSDEMLFQAGLDPRHAADGLDDDQLADLHRAMRHVLRIAIERQADPGRMPHSWLLPQRRKGGVCPRCGTPLRQIKVSGRTAHLCPQCQR